MIRLEDETLVPLSQVPRLLPVRPSGKRVHISAVYRWASRGVRGNRLETVKIGGTRYTSREALQRFADRQSEIETPSASPNDSPARGRQLKRAEAELDELLSARGGGGKKR